MAGAQLSILQHFLDRRGQVEQAQGIRDVTAAPAKDTGKVLLGMVEFLYKPMVALSPFDWRQVPALDVFDLGKFKRLTIRDFADNNWNCV